MEQDKVLSNFYEQVKDLEAAVAKSNRATKTVEKDVRELQIEINDEKRQIDLKKRKVLLKRKLEEEIIMLQIEVEKLQCIKLSCLLKQSNQQKHFQDNKPSKDSEGELSLIFFFFWLMPGCLGLHLVFYCNK